MRVLHFVLLSLFVIGVFASEYAQMLKDTQKAYDELLETVGKEYGAVNVQAFLNGWHSTGGDEVVLGRFMKSIMETKSFKYAMSGTSVTAAGDCYWNESYVNWVDQLMKPVAKASGVDFNAVNIAQGKNPHMPYAVCMDAWAGQDADMISWEQDMMCGRGNTKHCIEEMLRTSYQMDSHPILSAILPSAHPMSLRKYMGMTMPVSKNYADFGYHVITSPEPLGHIQNLDDPMFSSRRMYVEGKRFGHASWHPSPYGHRFIGHSIAVLYATKWLEAVKSMDGMGKAQSKEYVDKWTAFKHLPETSCDKENCRNGANTFCKTMYAPRTNPKGSLMGLVVNTQIEDLTVDNLHQFASPKIKNEEIESKWQAFNLLGTGNPREAESRKIVLQGNQLSGPITFQFHTSSSKAQVNICAPYRTSHSGNLHEHSTFELDGKSVAVEGKADYCFTIGDVHGSGEHTLRVIPSDIQTVQIATLYWIEAPK